MKVISTSPPEADEYAPSHAGYVALVREREPLGVLRRQLPVLRSVCTGMSEREALTRYAPDKWSLKEVIGHLSDTERILCYRLLGTVRGDTAPLAGFDENAYVQAGGFEARSLPSLLRELESTRAASLRLIETVPPEAWTRRGVVQDRPVSARALVYILAGHMEHHFEILRERYGIAIPHVEAPPA